MAPVALSSSSPAFRVGVREKERLRGLRERRERDRRLRARCTPRGHPLGYVGGGDQVGAGDGAGRALELQPCNGNAE